MEALGPCRLVYLAHPMRTSRMRTRLKSNQDLVSSSRDLSSVFGWLSQCAAQPDKTLT